MTAAVGPFKSRETSAIVELIGRERLMTIAVNRPDGWPQATTVGYTNEGLDLFFVIARASQKFANLQQDPRASIAIRSIEGGSGVGVSMAGRAVEVTDPANIERLNQLIIHRYPDVHIYSPSADSIAVMHFRPGIVSTVGVVHGRSSAQIFSTGIDEPETGQLEADKTPLSG